MKKKITFQTSSLTNFSIPSTCFFLFFTPIPSPPPPFQTRKQSLREKGYLLNLILKRFLKEKDNMPQSEQEYKKKQRTYYPKPCRLS
jgi:hypothetical protein